MRAAIPAVHNSDALRPTLCVIRPMPRKLLKRYLPDPVRLREHRHLRVFGERLTDPNLWHLNRRCVANGTFIGLFCALIPIPFQMFPAGLLAILVRANLPIAIVLVWLTNPLTAAPVWYGAYRFGSMLLGMKPSWQPEGDSLEALTTAMLANFGQIYLPMLVGSVVIGLVLAVCGWLGVHQAWRIHVRHSWRLRSRRRRPPQPPET